MIRLRNLTTGLKAFSLEAITEKNEAKKRLTL